MSYSSHKNECRVFLTSITIRYIFNCIYLQQMSIYKQNKMKLVMLPQLEI